MTDLKPKVNDHKIPLDDKGFLLMDQVETRFKSLFKNKHYKEAIDYLNDVKNHGPLNKHEDLIKLHDFYIEILLEIEDYPSLLNILKSKEKYLETKKSKTIHQFYLAICYEGLQEIKEAIQALEAIEDHISSQNIINKYLKLALLYIQEKDISQAKNAYTYALNFDKNKENEMFLLVESDLAYQENRLIDSMKIYEDFFIKSQRKLSYLNRFIRLSIGLERYTDAYEFYKRYLDKVINQASIQAKINFFSSALPLLKELNSQAYIEANNHLNELKQRESIHFDDFNYYQILLTQLKDQQIYLKEREIIRQTFIDLDRSKVFNKLVYLKIINAKVELLHYSKNLLLEKTYEDYHLIIDDILKDDYKNTYPRMLMDTFIFVDDTTDYIFVEKVQENEFLLSYTRKDNFDLGKKITILSALILSGKLRQYQLKNNQDMELHALKSFMDMKDLGLVKIKNHQMIFLNQQAKKILNLEKDMVAFNEIQKEMSPMLYLDQLTQAKSWQVSYKQEELRLWSFLLDYDIYLLVEEVKEKNLNEQDLEWKKNQNHGVLLVDISNYKSVIQYYGFNVYLDKLNDLLSQISSFSNHHSLAYKLESHHHLYILLNTRDKRVTERFSDKLSKAYEGLFNFSYAYQAMNYEFNKVKSSLIQLMAHNISQEVIYSDKSIRKQEETESLYLQTLDNIIKQKTIKLKHLYIKNWKHQKVTHIEIKPHHLNILTDKKVLNDVLDKNDLNIAYDKLIMNSLIQESKKLDKLLRWILPISIDSIKSKKAFNYLLRRLEVMKNHHVSFVLDIDDYLKLSSSDQTYLQEKEISICIKGQIRDIFTLESLKTLDYVYIDESTFNHEFNQIWIDALKKRFKHIIYDHGQETLVKADLERMDIELIKGEYAGQEND